MTSWDVLGINQMEYEGFESTDQFFLVGCGLRVVVVVGAKMIAEKIND